MQYAPNTVFIREDKDKYMVWCIGAWVTWPERPKGAKDNVKMPEGQKAGPKGRQLEVGAQRAPRLLYTYSKDPKMR